MRTVKSLGSLASRAQSPCQIQNIFPHETGKFVDAKLALSMYLSCYVISLLSSRSPLSCLFLIPLSKLDKVRGEIVLCELCKAEAFYVMLRENLSALA